ncbi:hypothetical protein EDB84DRAFT_1562638 [Lactarius hengduanensis]|nr:hypothetical protein EDB84DRAFT_1562638 [Lactarius hengduanensis]
MSAKESRKRKPTKRVTENGDPLARKKPKTTSARTTTATSTMGNSDAAAPASPPCAQSRAQRSIPEDADKSDDDGASKTSEPEPIELSSDDDSESVQVIEDDDSELDRLSKEWDSPIYAFFKPTPTIDYVDRPRCVIIAPRRRCIATADCRVVTVVVVAVFAAVVATVVTAVVAVVAAVVVATVAAVVVEESKLQRRPWRRLAITPAAAVMGAAAVVFGTCVAMMLAVGRSAGAGEVVVVGCRLRRVMPVLFSSLLSKFIDCALQVPPICTRYQPPPPPCHRQQQDGVDDDDSDNDDNNKAARHRRHDELDDHQPPPPPTGPCHRQWQDDVNNSNNADR